MLEIWTVYDHPSDFPKSYVARLFVDGKPSETYFDDSNLENVREVMRAMGQTCVTRHPSDDPVIVETWL